MALQFSGPQPWSYELSPVLILYPPITRLLISFAIPLFVLTEKWRCGPSAHSARTRNSKTSRNSLKIIYKFSLNLIIWINEISSLYFEFTLTVGWVAFTVRLWPSCLDEPDDISLFYFLVVLYSNPHMTVPCLQMYTYDSQLARTPMRSVSCTSMRCYDRPFATEITEILFEGHEQRRRKV